MFKYVTTLMCRLVWPAVLLLAACTNASPPIMLATDGVGMPGDAGDVRSADSGRGRTPLDAVVADRTSADLPDSADNTSVPDLDAMALPDDAGQPPDLPDVSLPDVPDTALPEVSDLPDIVAPDVSPDLVDVYTDSGADIADTAPEHVEEGILDGGIADVWGFDLPIPTDLTDAAEVEDLFELTDTFEVSDLAAEVEPEVLLEEVEPEPDCEGFVDGGPPGPPGAMLQAADFTKLGKAEPDETYVNGSGQEIAKTNQAYVWGLANEGVRTWVGTVANTLCIGFSGFGGVGLGYESANAVCDQMVAGNPVMFPDWRLPQLWDYNSDTSAWTRHTEIEGTLENPGISQDTMGWRAAISIGEYLLAAGPGTGFLWGMPGYGTSMVAFKNGEFVGQKKFTEHNDARKFLSYGGVVYLGSFKWDGSGVILRWDGDETSPPDSLFKFSEVGTIEGSAAWPEGYKERIYTVTWPTALVAGGSGFDVWRSPKIPECGLTEEHLDQWEKVFSYSDYDSNPDTAKLASGGAMSVFDGALYFGSMHVPFQYTCADPSNVMMCGLEKYLNTHALSLFRLTEDDNGDVSIECLFGQDKGGIYKPTVGAPGFGNHYNNYTWSMAVLDGWLYVGTMDYSFFMKDVLTVYGLPAQFPGMVPFQEHGFDIWATQDGLNWSSATTNGLGSKFNWGARQMTSDGQRLWLGTANPWNLNPAGGWELWKGEQ